MKSSDPIASAYRYCRYYMPEGRRGGNCSQLSVSVQGSWTACSLARPVFAPTWDFTQIRVWKEELLPTSLSTSSESNTENLRETSCPIVLEMVSSEKLSV